MNPITAALKNMQLRKLTRKYEALAKLNASEQYKADKAALAARLENYDRF